MRIDAEIDATGLLCPLPVLRLRKVLAGLSPGAVVRLLATDAAAWVDVPHFCSAAGHTVLAAEETNGTRQFLIRRG